MGVCTKPHLLTRSSPQSQRTFGLLDWYPILRRPDVRSDSGPRGRGALAVFRLTKTYRAPVAAHQITPSLRFRAPSR